MQRCYGSVFVFVAFLLLLGHTAPAGAQAPSHTFRAGVTYASPTGDANFRDPFDYVGALTFENEFDEAVGGSLAYEYRLSDLVGLEFGVTYVEPDVVTRIFINEGDPQLSPLYDTSDGVRMLPVTLGLNLHVFRGTAWDVYIGPQIAYVTYGTAELPLVDVLFGTFDGTFRFEFKDEFTWGAVAGADIALSPGWGLGLRAGYLDAAAEVDRAEFFPAVPDPGLPPSDPVPEYLGREFSPSPFLASVMLVFRY